MDADDASGHDEGLVCLRWADAMRGEDGVACLDHVPGVLDALFTGDCVCTTAVHDDSACSPARFLEDITGNKNGGGTERVEGEASSSRGRMGRSGQDKCEI